MYLIIIIIAMILSWMTVHSWMRTLPGCCCCLFCDDNNAKGKEAFSLESCWQPCFFGDKLIIHSHWCKARKSWQTVGTLERFTKVSPLWHWLFTYRWYLWFLPLLLIRVRRTQRKSERSLVWAMNQMQLRRAEHFCWTLGKQIQAAGAVFHSTTKISGTTHARRGTGTRNGAT